MACKKIAHGEIIALKGLGGFHLVCNGTDNRAVEKLRRRKNRPFKPFALMFSDIETLKEYVISNNKTDELLQSSVSPIVILNKIKGVLEEVKPDVVLVHGDTSTTFVTALAC